MMNNFFLQYGVSVVASCSRGINIRAFIHNRGYLLSDFFFLFLLQINILYLIVIRNFFHSASGIRPCLTGIRPGAV